MTPEAVIVERCADAGHRECHSYRLEEIGGTRWHVYRAGHDAVLFSGSHRDCARWVQCRGVLAVIRELAECEPTERMASAWTRDIYPTESAGRDWRAMLRALVEAAGRG